jgi:hypothetical protein
MANGDHFVKRRPERRAHVIHFRIPLISLDKENMGLKASAVNPLIVGYGVNPIGASSSILHKRRKSCRERRYRLDFSFPPKCRPLPATPPTARLGLTEPLS